MNIDIKRVAYKVTAILQRCQNIKQNIKLLYFVTLFIFTRVFGNYRR